MDSILNFIKPELLILVPVLYCVGLGLKRSKLSDRWIPLLLGAAGMGLSALYLLADGMAEASISAVCQRLFAGITQGILCAECAVYVHQIMKQTGKNGESA